VEWLLGDPMDDGKFRQALAKEVPGIDPDGPGELPVFPSMLVYMTVRLGPNPRAHVAALPGYSGIGRTAGDVPYLTMEVRSNGALPVYSALVASLDEHHPVQLVTPVEGNMFNIPGHHAFGLKPAVDIDNIIVRLLGGSLHGVDPREVLASTPEGFEDEPVWCRTVLAGLAKGLVPDVTRMLADLERRILLVEKEDGP